MDKVRRVLVHVCTERSSPQRALFVQSVTGHFSEGGADEVEVSCSLQRRRLVLSRGDGGRGSPLKRPAFCPIKHLSIAEAAAIPLDVQQRGVDVGVAIILQTANQRVLLTRRAKELRIFPNVWVPPGGHLEPDETLLEAGLRELWEETGLKLEPEGASPKILGLWESVYPAMLSRGPPERHHIVVYMLLLSSRSHLQLQGSLSPSPAEVSSCLWADRQLVRAIVSSGEEEGAVPLSDLQGGVSVTRVSPGGGLSEATLPLEVLMSRAPASGPDVERVSTGTKYALELWLRSLET
ncbi:nucleoside diphosphate-linked moiety X motif 17 isoform X2 [Pseudoliparis swirei]|uniref:nucleoside diphosphate-linked moiety X motif 17 isoform X2 n=1 Tax=Pseudoliparis swirei TaxID=2059687 RepID=UPI0024BEA1E8|nr:nucleoside diphosphate-linked moiety X motif 17 isoform X2 [Pseudoliparis swirei]